MGSIPYFLAAAAVCRHQFDWRLPQVMTVSAFFSRMSAEDEFELPRLVAAESQARQVVALDVDLGPASSAVNASSFRRGVGRWIRSTLGNLVILARMSAQGKSGHLRLHGMNEPHYRTESI